jgi:hypothetical protein
MRNLPLSIPLLVALVALALGAAPVVAQRGGANARALDLLPAALVRGQRVTGLVAAVVRSIRFSPRLRGTARRLPFPKGASQ